MGKVYDYFNLLYSDKKLVQSFLIGNVLYCDLKDELENIMSDFIFNKKINIENNPDIIVLENNDKNISKDDIRRVLSESYKTSQFNNNKVIIIENCESLNSFSYNALLKTIEEPPLGVYFILLSSNIDSVISTISSRCQKIFISSDVRNHEYNENYKDLTKKIVDSIEQYGLKIISKYSKIYSEISDRNVLQIVMNNILIEYNDLLKNKIDDNLNEIFDQKEIINLSKKIIVINDNLNRLNNPMMKNISIDRFIIEMWRCNNENS